MHPGTMPSMKTVRFHLDPMPPFRLDLTVWALRRRASNIIDRWDGSTWRRTLRIRNAVVQVAATQVRPPDAPRLKVEVSAPESLRIPRAEISACVTRMLGLERDLTPFYRMAHARRVERDSRELSALVERMRGFKPPVFPTVFEGVVNAIACQQLSLAVGISLLGRLTEAYGRTLRPRSWAIPNGALQGPDGGTTPRAFPEAEDLADARIPALREMGFSTAKAEAIVGVARAIASGGLDLENLRGLDDETAAERLLALRGIGRWSAAYILLRSLGRLAVFPQEDSGAREKLQRLLRMRTPPEWDRIAKLLRPWHPFAGLLYYHLLLGNLAEKGHIA